MKSSSTSASSCTGPGSMTTRRLPTRTSTSWWGKVRSPNRQQPLRRAPEIIALAQELTNGRQDETHLYVTDYRSLFAGELLEIREGDLPPAERAHVPAYYAERELTCDFWFKLGDMRRVVRDDLPEVARELQKLRNVHYNDRPVSLYGGMVDIPLIVTRPDATRFFDPDERDAITEGALWAEYDAERGAGANAIQRDLRLNVLGDEVWDTMDLTARASIADAERIFRDHRDDPGYDFSPVVVGFARGLEIQANAILRGVASRLPAAVRVANIDGREVDLAKSHGLSLGQLARVIAGDRERFEALSKLLANGAWFTGQLPPTLDEIRELRNRGAHAGRLTRAEATPWRNRILGIGTQALLVELAKTRLKGK